MAPKTDGHAAASGKEGKGGANSEEIMDTKTKE